MQLVGSAWGLYKMGRHTHYAEEFGKTLEQHHLCLSHTLHHCSLHHINQNLLWSPLPSLSPISSSFPQSYWVVYKFPKLCPRPKPGKLLLLFPSPFSPLSHPLCEPFVDGLQRLSNLVMSHLLTEQARIECSSQNGNDMG